MKRELIRSPRARAVVALGAVAMLGGGLVATTAASAGGNHKVTICHATNSRTNPYVGINVDYHSVTQGGHGRHDGPIFAADLPDRTKWGDIVPPFDLGDGVVYAGKNWPAGEAVFANGCSLASPTTTTSEETTTTTEETTTTTEETTTTTEETTTTISG